MNQQQIDEEVIQNFQLLKKIGSGAYSHVWRVREKATGNILALKKIFDVFRNYQDAKRTLRQIKILRQLQHPGVISLNKYFFNQQLNNCYLVLDHMESDLSHAISQGRLQDCHIRFIACQLLHVLKYFESVSLVYRDLKTQNVLINSNSHIKICDFGSARDYNISHTPNVGSRWYRAPEVLLGEPASLKSDLWSVGCIVVEMYLGHALFSSPSVQSQMEKILGVVQFQYDQLISYERSQIQFIRTLSPVGEASLKKIPFEVLSFLSLIFRLEPTSRASIHELLQHPWLQQLELEHQIQQRRCVQIPQVKTLDQIKYLLVQEAQPIKSISKQNSQKIKAPKKLTSYSQKQYGQPKNRSGKSISYKTQVRPGSLRRPPAKSLSQKSQSQNASKRTVQLARSAKKGKGLKKRRMQPKVHKQKLNLQEYLSKIQ